jgi:hypothetical protein
MELIPQELQQTIPKLYETEDITDPICYVHLFRPDANWSWFITEISIDSDICFGYVISPFCDGELGYISLEELKGIKGSLGIGVERDVNFMPTPLSLIKKAS